MPTVVECEASAISKPPSITRILIVDGQPIVRCGLSELISHQPEMEVCGESEGTADALEQFKTMSPEMVIVEISLKEGSGIDLIKLLKARRDDIKILVFSSHSELIYAVLVLRAGAMGFVSKQEPTGELIAAILRVQEGQVYLSPRMAEQILHRVVNGKEPGVPLQRLSDRELEVFEMIGRALTTQQIAANLHLSPKTIETHRENIKKKLGLNNSIELTHRAICWGLQQA